MNCVRAVFFLNVKIFATWQDPSLHRCGLLRAEQLRSERAGPTVLRWARDHGLLQPDLEVINANDVACLSTSIRVSDRETGRVKYTMHLSGWFDLELGLSLEHFPFDFHDLRICVRPRSLDKSRALLVPWPGTHAIDQLGGNSSEWRIVGHRCD